MLRRQYPKENDISSGFFMRYSRYWTRELHYAFKAECARRNLTMSRVMARLVRKWLEKKQRFMKNGNSQRWI